MMNDLFKRDVNDTTPDHYKACKDAGMDYIELYVMVYAIYNNGCTEYCDEWSDIPF